jgi:CBS domain-containing protein
MNYRSEIHGGTDPADGHYLNLPVVEDDGRLVGIVDVLKLTYATLEQVSVALARLALVRPLMADRIYERECIREWTDVGQILRQSRWRCWSR